MSAKMFVSFIAALLFLAAPHCKAQYNPAYIVANVTGGKCMLESVRGCGGVLEHTAADLLLLHIVKRHITSM
jgi:hypothetical protein